jgi:CO dehydrogenase maturation factor
MKVIAITGKGGTGKTAVAGMLIKQLSKGKKTLLAIDADPDSNLPDVLGVQVDKTIGDMREFMLQERDKLPPDTSKERLLESKVYEVLIEMPHYDLLVMGRPEGSGCYCFANNLLRGIMDRILKNYEITLPGLSIFREGSSAMWMNCLWSLTAPAVGFRLLNGYESWQSRWI